VISGSRFAAALAAVLALGGGVAATAPAANQNSVVNAGRCFERVAAGPAGSRDALVARLILRRQRLGHVLSGSYGYSVGYYANKAVDAKLALFVEGRLARRLDPGGRGPVYLAGGTNTLACPGRGAIVAQFSRKEKRVLRKRRKVELHVRLSVTALEDGENLVKRGRVTVRRRSE
jgi:hypothetical protein